MKHHYQAYVQATHTAPKTKQVVMLYDGAIRFVQQAKEAISDQRIEDRYHLLVKATEVIYGLQGALDFENGGRVARILYNYYSTIDMKLFSIQHSNSLSTCDEVIEELKQMRDVWAEIDHSTQSGKVINPEAAVEPAADSGPAPAEPNGKQPPQNVTLSA